MQLHASWESIIEPLIKSCDPHIVVEIGTGTAALTRKLLPYCSQHGAILHSVDPEPDCDIEELTKQYGSTFIFHRDFSFSVLSKIGSCDVVLIDGDHNWYTVYNELKILELNSRKPADFPLVILHDTGWPYGFRDTYIDPERIPATFRQPYKKGGVHPDSGLLSDKGINTDFYHALYEGNPHNGVSAAVKDFVNESELELAPIFLPGGHGLGILTSSQRLKKNSVLSSQFENLRLSPILNTHIDAIEHDRIRILLDCQSLQQIAETRHQELSQLRCEQYDLTITAEQLRNSNINLSAANEQLWMEKMNEQQLKEEAEKMREEEKQLKEESEKSLAEKDQLIKRIMQSRSWRWTELLRRGEAALWLLFKPRVLVNHLAYSTIGILHDIWTDFGEPCPKLVRGMRHNLLGKIIPVINENTSSDQSGNANEADKTSEKQSAQPGLLFPPGHYYSPIPSLEEIQEREEEIFKMISPDELGGIDLHTDDQLQLLYSFRQFNTHKLMEDIQSGVLRYKTQNGAFNENDAVVLHCMMQHLKPKRIIEVGCGWSSAMILDTLDRAIEHTVSYTAIDPYPDQLLAVMRNADNTLVDIVPKKLEQIDAGIFTTLQKNDILFIDSSHVVKTGSDVHHLLTKILPMLQNGVYVHFHDIMYPFEYPKEWVLEGRAWNEAYCLQTFLEHNSNFSIVLFGSYIKKYHSDAFAYAIPALANLNDGLGSLWIKSSRGVIDNEPDSDPKLSESQAMDLE